MADHIERRPRKSFLSYLVEIFIFLCVVAVSAGLGWFVGRSDVKDVRAINRQLQEERAKSAELRQERTELRAQLTAALASDANRQETDVDQLLARKEAEWKREFNRVRIEAEVEKARRVEELEREIRQLKIDQRIREEMASGDDSAVPESVAQGLTPRARQVCADLLAWEALEPEAREAARSKLANDLGARSLVRVKFASGSAHVGNDDLDALRVAMADTKDYSLILAVGFADTGGDEELNRELGSLRAKHTADALRELLRGNQLVEYVYLGETDRFGEKRADNRAVEVWELQR
ncbi:hypothetical protein [Roseibacillus ishigakijimensis]|uniref:OmpA-like domain-containing protein n=1 Tax=Roseibacillus ishigakijimensis TaxID=454146 RepID=A0A934RQG4_9BACT|nr:hypothetical protein [Roseibacillus ishigakijimensis]MBK1833711.1 hypothetical protein [Roseibacillus ishigakijimensis]